MTNQSQFKVADSILTDEDGYAKGTLSLVEFDQYLNEETGELTDQILFEWEVTTRKGKPTKLRFWTGMNINPVPRKVNGLTIYNGLTTILLMHRIITSEDLKKLAQDETYINQLEIDLESLIGQTHKFKLNNNERGLSKPDITTLKLVKPLSVGVTSKPDNNTSEDNEE